VGGIKEKVLAAHRMGIKEVILPKRNEKAVKEDIPDNVRADLKIHLVSSIEEVLELALTPGDPYEMRADHQRWHLRLSHYELANPGGSSPDGTPLRLRLPPHSFGAE